MKNNCKYKTSHCFFILLGIGTGMSFVSQEIVSSRHNIIRIAPGTQLEKIVNFYSTINYEQFTLIGIKRNAAGIILL